MKTTILAAAFFVLGIVMLVSGVAIASDEVSWTTLFAGLVAGVLFGVALSALSHALNRSEE